MPLLDLGQLTALRSKPAEVCLACERAVNPNYCRECDEYFEAGHLGVTDECRRNASHDSHRTY